MDRTLASYNPSQDGKIDATITTVHDGYAFALDAFGQEYFIPWRNIEMIGRFHWEDLRRGSSVRLRPIEPNRRGYRLNGIEVEILAI